MKQYQYTLTPAKAAPPTAVARRAPRVVRGALPLLFALLSVVLVACGQGRADEVATTEVTITHRVEDTKTLLSEARTAASDYGMKHLGHYLDFSRKSLRKAGVASEGIELRVKTTHTGYCIIATNSALPEGHPWRTATVGSLTQQASTTDDCK